MCGAHEPFLRFAANSTAHLGCQFPLRWWVKLSAGRNVLGVAVVVARDNIAVLLPCFVRPRARACDQGVRLGLVPPPRVFAKQARRALKRV